MASFRGACAQCMKIFEEDFAKEVFRVSPKYCASLPDEYIDFALASISTLRKMGSG